MVVGRGGSEGRVAGVVADLAEAGLGDGLCITEGLICCGYGWSPGGGRDGWALHTQLKVSITVDVGSPRWDRSESMERFQLQVFVEASGWMMCV